ncbi:MAG: rRNA pseudouridine synthase [Zetaproteobacteria bacterium]|nr:rRNA pseudouridine synthase [Zetaproteobacteria bacterium]
MIQKQVTYERLDKLLSRLGYGSRNDVRYWLKEGWVTVQGSVPKSPSERVDVDTVEIEGAPLDHPHGLTIIYHKPLGSVCSHKESGRLVYDDFPARWKERKPAFSCVGRLDKETSGLLFLTDDGQLNHQITSPKYHVPKRYDVYLAEALRGNEAELFAKGTLMLDGDDTPCLPAELIVHDARHVEVVLQEGRYHQVRRMFAAVGNHVEGLARTHVGALSLADLALPAGGYCVIAPEQLLNAILGVK